MARRAIRVCDLAEPETLSAKLDELLLHHNTLLRRAGRADLRQSRRCSTRLLALAPQHPAVSPSRSGSGWTRPRRAGKRILFEGAQAVMLDVDHGTYPFVTSQQHRRRDGRRRAPASGRRAVGFVLGIAKAYTTRVGLRAVPDRAARRDRRSCSAIAATNSAPSPAARRRCGWFDAALVRQAVKVGGIQGLALTKLDVLDGLPELKICTGYRVGGETIRRLPAGARRAGRGGAGIRDDGGLVRLDRAARGPGPTCRRRRSNTSAASRNWSRRRSRCCPPARSATTRSWCATRSRTEAVAGPVQVSPGPAGHGVCVSPRG